MKGQSFHKTLLSRLIGYGGSLVLTFTAYLLIVHPEAFSLKVDAVIKIIFILALLQGVVQAICFLHILSERGPRWNLVIFISTISMIIIIVVGSIWIMSHLNYNMMPMKH
jgi:cytochrome o ubiquinol oxidase operon protein cyoD